MVRVAVVAGDPVCGGADVDSCLKNLLVEIHVGEHAVEGEAVGPRRDDLSHGSGSRDSDGRQSHDLSGVPADLLRGVAVQPDQLQVRMAADSLDHLGTDVAGCDLEYPDLSVLDRTHAVL